MRSIRFSIAGLMGFILVVALVAAAMRNPTAISSGFVAMATRGIFCIALVGAVCRKGAQRAWWVGFASFGWIYLGVPFSSAFRSGLRPVQMVLEAFGTLKDLPNQNSSIVSEELQSFLTTSHCLWALVAAAIGGLIARAIFGTEERSQGEAAAGAQPAAEAAPTWSPAALAVLVSGLALFALVVLFWSQLDERVWAGCMYLFTWWLIGLAAIAALCGHGRRRESWLGAAFLGAGFMILVFSRLPDDPAPEDPAPPTFHLLEAARPHVEGLSLRLSGDPGRVEAANARIEHALDQQVAMQFPNFTSLDYVLRHIRDATRGPGGSPIAIFVDPIGLEQVHKNMASDVRGMNLEGIRLRTTLQLFLRQLGLEYVVKDGVLLITDPWSARSFRSSRQNDPFSIVGQCVFALIAAGLGWFATPIVCNLARRKNR
jgi:hypothetical protein